MKYQIKITKGTDTQGRITFTDGPVGINCVCYYKATTPVESGNTYTGAATRMTSKCDSKSPKYPKCDLNIPENRRPGIFFRELAAREIFIHEGKDVSWSDNCIVLDRAEMMKMWDHIVDQGDEEKYVISIVVD